MSSYLMINIFGVMISCQKSVLNAKPFHRYAPHAEPWLGETSSTWRGGSPGLSDRFVAGFM